MADPDAWRQALTLAVTENWLHARHVESLRERQNQLWWISWGAVLTYMTTQSATASSYRPHVFLLMAIFSAVAVATSLKWTAEFSNHIAAVYRSANLLGLVAASPGTPTSNRAARLLSVSGLLPYPEFAGELALPLDLPIFLNVGPMVTLLQCVGVGTAVFGWLHEWLGESLLGLSVTTAVAVTVVALAVSFYIARLTRARIAARTRTS